MKAGKEPTDLTDGKKAETALWRGAEIEASGAEQSERSLTDLTDGRKTETTLWQGADPEESEAEQSERLTDFYIRGANLEKTAISEWTDCTAESTELLQ